MWTNQWKLVCLLKSLNGCKTEIIVPQKYLLLWKWINFPALFEYNIKKSTLWWERADGQAGICVSIKCFLRNHCSIFMNSRTFTMKSKIVLWKSQPTINEQMNKWMNWAKKTRTTTTTKWREEREKKCFSLDCLMSGFSFCQATTWQFDLLYWSFIPRTTQSN